MAKLFHVGLDESLAIRIVLQVEGYQVNTAAIHGDIIGCRFGVFYLLWEMRDGDASETLDRKHGCGSPSDAAVTTGDEGVLAPESVDVDDGVCDEARKG